MACYLISPPGEDVWEDPPRPSSGMPQLKMEECFLHVCRRGTPELVQLFLDHDMRPGMLHLKFSIFVGSFAITRLLLQYEAKVENPSPELSYS